MNAGDPTPLEPTTLVRCEPYRCSLAARACVLRFDLAGAPNSGRAAISKCNGCPIGAERKIELDGKDLGGEITFVPTRNMSVVTNKRWTDGVANAKALRKRELDAEVNKRATEPEDEMKKRAQSASKVCPGCKGDFVRLEKLKDGSRLCRGCKGSGVRPIREDVIRGAEKVVGKDAVRKTLEPVPVDPPLMRWLRLREERKAIQRRQEKELDELDVILKRVEQENPGLFQDANSALAELAARAAPRG